MGTGDDDDDDDDDDGSQAPDDDRIMRLALDQQLANTPIISWKRNTSSDCPPSIAPSSTPCVAPSLSSPSLYEYRIPIRSSQGTLPGYARNFG